MADELRGVDEIELGFVACIDGLVEDTAAVVFDAPVATDVAPGGTVLAPAFSLVDGVVFFGFMPCLQFLHFFVVSLHLSNK